MRPAAKAFLVVLAGFIGMAPAGCGSGGTAVAPRACSLLTDSDIQAAVHQVPSSVGGGESGRQSTCAWALPNQAGGSVSAVLVTCDPTAGCAGPFTSLAPARPFTDIPGIGTRARISTAPGAADGIVLEQHGSVLQLRVDRVDTDARAALLELARRGARRL